MKNAHATFFVLLLLGCNQENSSGKEEKKHKETQKISLDLDVSGDEEAIKRNKEDPQNGFCDYYLKKQISSPSDRNSLGFCYAKGGDLSKAEIHIWTAARGGDPLAIENKSKIISEYKKLGIKSFSHQSTGLSVDETLNGRAPIILPVSDGAFAWKLTTLGSVPYGEIVLRGSSTVQGAFTVKAWYLDRKNVPRSSVAKIVELPLGMSVNVSLAGDTSFTYPSEDWSYVLEISELMTGRKIYTASGPLPIDYDGEILGGKY